MESTWLLILAFSIAWVVSLSFLSKIITHRKQKLPPGPKPWPIIGNLLDLRGSQALELLVQKYGDLVYLKFGSRPVVLASSPELAKEFLKTQDSICANRPTTAAGKYTSYNYSAMTFSSYGPYFRQGRKIFTTELLNAKRISSYEYIRVEEVRVLISRLYALSGKPFLLRVNLAHHSISVISRMLFSSSKYFTASEANTSTVVTVKELSGIIDKWTWLGGVINIGDWIPWLSKFDLQGYVKQMKELHKEFDKFLSSVIHDHQTKREAEKDFLPKDMVDILLKVSEDQNLELEFTENSVKGLLQDLLVGGADSFPSMIEWTLYELFKQPRIFEKATEELDRVIGRDRWVEEEDCSELRYIDAIVKETLRLHPLTCLLTPHSASEDCNVAGYDIPKGTIILINLWSLARDPKYWDLPYEYLPERFLENDIDIMGNNFYYLPFGSGRRMCPGYALGLRILRTTLANLLHGFKWKLSNPDTKPADLCVDGIDRLVSFPKVSHPVIAEPRLDVHLY